MTGSVPYRPGLVESRRLVGTRSVAVLIASKIGARWAFATVGCQS
jgi:hypothetical protein